MSKITHYLISFICILFLTNTILAQDPNVVGNVTVKDLANNDPLYLETRNLSSAADAFSGEYARVNNLTFKKDAADISLASGEIYFLKSVQGKVVGAVFLGNGRFSLTPPVEVEKKHLSIFTGSNDINESFDKLVMFFSDKTFDEIKQSPNVQMATGGSQAGKARDVYREKQELLRKDFHYNVYSRILSDFYAPQRKGFFMTFIEGSKFGKLIYQIDPLGVGEVYPEQVSLTSFGETTGGIWTAFHLEDEYKKGTATSWQDRRSYDITHHNIDTAVDGTRLFVKDEITIQMREKNARFLPFDLYRSLRVKSVVDETGSALSYIQEKKDEDADFGVILPEAKETGKPFKITVEYEGTEALREAGSGNFILIPRSTWYPNNPNSSFGDRAKFDLTFRYPKKYVMVGIGSRVGEETVEGNQKVAKWSSGDLEMAVAGFNYGDFKMKNVNDKDAGYDLEVFVNRELPDEMKNIQRNADAARERGGDPSLSLLQSINTTGMATTVLVEAQNATRIYNAFFGKLPYKRVAMTQQPAGFFGQAWGTLIFMPYIAFIDDTHRVQLFGISGGTNGFWREVAAHEVAHQWWGHMVGWTSYHDQWMSEGFSEFSTSLYIFYIKKDINKFIDFWEDQRSQITQATPQTNGRKPYTVGPLTQGYRLNSAKTGNIARSMIYPKGAFVLHMLRMMMYDRKNGTGDTKFQEMMKDFIASHFNQDVSTNDFKKIVEKHMLPSMDIYKNGSMDWFFDEWIYGTEMPSYDFSYQLSSGANGQTLLSGKITQSGVSDKFVMPVPLYMDFGKGWVYLGSATLVGNSSVELKNIALPEKPKRVAVAALQDILVEKNEAKKQ